MDDHRDDSSISMLDSVIGHLDMLLARNRSDCGSSIDENSCQPEEKVEEEEDCFNSDVMRPVLDVAQEIQRVMDLSFASVYELPTGRTSLAASAELCHVMGSDVDSGVESKSDVTSVSDTEAEPLTDYQNLPPTWNNNNSNNNNNNNNVIIKENVNNVVNSGLSKRCHRNRTVEKFYEICLGHFCLQLDCGSDRKISIFSLQKHADELNGSSIQQQQQQQQQQSGRKSQQQQHQQHHNQKHLHQRQSSADSHSSKKNGQSSIFIHYLSSFQDLFKDFYIIS